MSNAPRQLVLQGLLFETREEKLPHHGEALNTSPSLRYNGEETDNELSRISPPMSIPATAVQPAVPDIKQWSRRPLVLPEMLFVSLRRVELFLRLLPLRPYGQISECRARPRDVGVNPTKGIHNRRSLQDRIGNRAFQRNAAPSICFPHGLPSTVATCRERLSHARRSVT